MTDNRTEGDRRWRWSAAAVLLIALATRLAMLGAGPWADTRRAILPDSQRYIDLARNLQQFRSFGLVEEEGSPPWRRTAELRDANGTRPPRDAFGLRPESFRTPGYPAFLAVVGLPSDDLRVPLALQCLLGSITAALTVPLARRLGLTWPVAVGVGLLWALHPALILHDNVLLTESLFNASIAAGLLVAARSSGAIGWVIAGALIGLAGLTRPLVGLLFLPAALVLTWPGRGRRLVALLCIGVAALAPTLGWALRNRAAGDGLRVSSIGDLTLLYYAAAYAISEERGEDWFRSWPRRVDELATRLGERLAPGEDVFSASRSLAQRELLDRPGMTMRVLAKSQVKLMLDHSLGDAATVLGRTYRPTGLFSRLVLGQPGPDDGSGPGMVALAATWTLLNGTIAALALAGLGLALRRRDIRLILACGVPLVLVALVTSTNGLERFRVVMMLPLFLLAASVFSRPGRQPAGSATQEPPGGQPRD